MKKTICEKCKRYITNNNFKSHNSKCDGTYFEGPNKPYKAKPYKQRIAWNKGLTESTDLRVKKYAESIRLNIKKRDKSYLTDPKYINQLSENAKKQGFGGYRKNAGISKKFKYVDSFGKEVCLQSSYELKCAELLDNLGINWIRPKYLKYREKKYFPDFYLVDYDIYLDPKNDFLARKDKEKIDCVCEENNVKVYILTEEKITKEYLTMLVGPKSEGLA